MAGAGDFFLGKDAKIGSVSGLDPGQQQLLQQLLQQLKGPLESGFQNIANIQSGAPGAFEAFEAPAKRQFQEELLPQLAEGFGGLGATSSSGAQQTFARAGERLSESLAGQRAELQQSSFDRLLQALQSGLSPTREAVVSQPTSGFLGQSGSILDKILRIFGK